MTREQKAKLSDIRRQIRVFEALALLHREWSPGALFLERRGAVQEGGVVVHVNEAAGEVGGGG